ncbi:VPA1269 family protein [Pseudomonas sp. TMP25]|uniref:gamma-mobile-trio integrase GmtZ n=1 Tax=Pseudomonas sp. TMP25 TaxID=3136561 RepID=UPI0031017325
MTSPGFYPRLILARAAAKALGINSVKEYNSNYKKDLRLPSHPSAYYLSEWEGWSEFFGRVGRSGKYLTLDEASVAARCLGIKSADEYSAKYKNDPRLPSMPQYKYPNEWSSWYVFLDTTISKGRYPTLAEAENASRKLGFTRSSDYRFGYKKDPRLPSSPALYYENWGGWKKFLGVSPPARKYKKLDDASAAARSLGIASIRGYTHGYKKDPRLPSSPVTQYPDEWITWYEFLGTKPRREQFYSTWAEAREASRALGIKNGPDYFINYKKDLGLPGNPERCYASEWSGWYSFLCDYEPGEKYSKFVDAMHAAQRLGFNSEEEYRSGYIQDPRLPPDPQITYQKEWVNWYAFLLPTQYTKLTEVKRAVKALKIKDSVDYRKKYKLYPPLPSHPERMFKEEWSDWYDLCDMPRPYSYLDAREIIISKGLSAQRAYLDYIFATGDLRMPRCPDLVYKESWISWHVFLGKEEPFTTKYIRSPYLQWKVSIREFMKVARGGKSKESFLCRFLRYYIEKLEFGRSPEEFLTSTNVDVHKFKELLGLQVSDGARRGLFVAVNEFLDHILKTKLILEDECTGELSTVKGARNPLSNLVVGSEYVKNQLGETCKPALAYQYVQSVREWIIPDGARYFSELVNLHGFDADWVEVDINSIDENDPDCVLKIANGKLKMWCPIYWLHTYALVSVPARGRQIAYVDSGEGDEYIPVLADKQVVWEVNCSPLAGLTDNQGFIKRYLDDQCGMHFTTNKTSNQGQGYDVAWIPYGLIYWVVRLRQWQQKYNPITRPLPWFECNRTGLNESQLKAKGSNCFLFRDFGDEEPGHFSGRLSNRLAAALYNIQPKDIVLSELSGGLNTLSCYSSRYTPHSMRVSLITAYVEEFGLPIEIIMKVAGHSSIIMSIYYLKSGSESLRHSFEEGEKRALKSKAYAAQRMIEQGRIDEIKHELVSVSSEALSYISNDIPAGSFLFRDYGFCPFAGSRCSDGGELIGNTRVRAPVLSGYLGSQNCVRCRHFVSGPVFIGGLLSLGNEISMQANSQFQCYSDLEEKIIEARKILETLDEEEYSALRGGESYNYEVRYNLESDLRKTKSESESAAKKLDVLMCDIQSVSRLIKQCQALINQQVGGSENCEPQLILQFGNELYLALEEASRFRQCSVVCENAEIYESASAETSIMPRSQLIDRMIANNGMQPIMFSLSKSQQLIIGNQITKMLLSRLKSWEKIDALIDGSVLIKDLIGSERITSRDISSLFTDKVLLIE